MGYQLYRDSETKIFDSIMNSSGTAKLYYRMDEFLVNTRISDSAL